MPLATKVPGFIFDLRRRQVPTGTATNDLIDVDQAPMA